jgi:hypothetical protein
MDARSTRGSVAWRAAAIALFATAVIFSISNVGFPRERPQQRSTCMNNISQLAQEFLMARQEKRFDPTLHGSAQILSWFGVNGLKVGGERVLFCPGDVTATVPETADERRPFHPVDAAALRRAIGLGSYAVRDFERFPIAEGDDHAWILCDRQGENGRTAQHQGGVVVAFSGGDAQFMKREDLGIDSESDIVVGPDSPNADLRKMERP